MPRRLPVTFVALLVGLASLNNVASADEGSPLRGQPVAVGAGEGFRGRTGLEPFGMLGAESGDVRVEVLIDGSEASAAKASVRRLGGSVVGEADGVLLVDIPRKDAASLATRSERIRSVRNPTPVNITPAPIQATTASVGAGDLAGLVGADAWHTAGQTGAGVRVGIIDYFDAGVWATAEAAGAVPSVSGTFCLNVGSPCDLWSAGSPHGVAVAEGIHEIAPDAALYLATVNTVTDLAAAVAWFDANGVTVVNRSLASFFDSAGNGTGPQNAVVDDAVARGITWFNAAGNHASQSGVSAGGYWRGSWIDLDLDGWLEFAPGDEELLMSCVDASDGFRWSDWGPNRTDYDVGLFDADTDEFLEASINDQSTGAEPLEFVGALDIDCDLHPLIYAKVTLFDAGNGTGGDVLEFKLSKGAFEYSQNPYSAASPIADSKNAGLMAVGAIDPGDGITIAPYSSQGPTNDGRIKPGIVAPSCYPSVSYSPSCFNGTSAASPVAAGVAALVTGAGVATTPGTITAYLKDMAIDRGTPGADNVYGHGQLRLGSPPIPLEFSTHDLALVDPSQGQWHMYDGAGSKVSSFYFGNPGDHPIVGDWNCDGTETVGMYRQSDGYVYLRNSNTQGVADIRFYFGNPGDVPIAGDFNGDGCGTVSIYRPSNQTFYIINKLGKNDGGLGAAETSYVFGNPGDKPFVGDFDGDGVETAGLHRESTGLVYFRNVHSQGNAHKQFIFGDPGDVLFAGDWNGDDSFSPAIYRPSNMTAYFRFTNTQGNADAQLQPAGAQTSWLPVAGVFG